MPASALSAGRSATGTGTTELQGVHRPRPARRHHPGITTIDDSAFYECDTLLSAALPEGLSSIGGWAFYGATSLGSVSFPESLTSIGREAFFGATSLASVSFPSSLASIGNYAFYGATRLPTWSTCHLAAPSAAGRSGTLLLPLQAS